MSVGVLKGWNVFGLELLTLCTMISWFTLFGLKLHIKPLQTRSPCNRSEQTYCKCVCVCLFVCTCGRMLHHPLHPIRSTLYWLRYARNFHQPIIKHRGWVFEGVFSVTKKKMMRGLPSSQPLVTGTLAVTYCNIILPS